MAKGKTKIGTISHTFPNIGVAVVDLTGTLKVGDEISIEGSTTKIKQKVDSMQIEREPVNAAKKGQSIGMKVSDKVRKGDVVYKA